MKLNKITQGILPLRAGDEPSGGDKTWLESLPEDIRGNSALENVKDIGDLANQFVNAQSFLGSSIRIPSENAGEEDTQKFYEKVLKHAPNLMPVPNLEDEAGLNAIFSKLGRPADADTYAIENVELTPEMKKAAHEAGLTQAQFKAVYGQFIQPSIEAGSAHKAEVKAGRDKLAEEWGYAFQTKEQTAQALLAKTGAPQALVDAAAKGELNADTLRWVDSLATSIGKEGLDLVNHGQQGGRMTPAEASAQINEIMMNKEHAFWKASNPGHEQAKRDIVDLQRIANPK
ncbi:hypothetical protein VPHK225_0005 [Vibrio phage K225]|nr:hypothetical protein PODOV044v1_p0008 [Vibrio phage 23E28.1]QZI92083.1 hypothetical protein PODOV045v1_p0041 [Vibrio phage 69E27.1]